MKSGCLVDLVSRPDLVIVGNFTQVRGAARDRRSGFFCGDEPDAVTSGGATCTSSESGGSTGSRGIDVGSSGGPGEGGSTGDGDTGRCISTDG